MSTNFEEDERYLKMGHADRRAFALAVKLCDRMGRQFRPNLLFELRWSDPVSREQVKRDLEWYFFSIELLIYGQDWKPIEHSFLIPYLSIFQDKDKVRKCKVWSQIDEQLLDRLPMNKVLMLWARITFGCCPDLLSGEEDAFCKLREACKAKGGKRLFILNNTRRTSEEISQPPPNGASS